MPTRPRSTDITNKLPAPLPRRLSPGIPAFYSPFPERPPTRPGWYLCWSGPQAQYLEWPGDWDGVTHYVELPALVQRVLNLKLLKTRCKTY